MNANKEEMKSMTEFFNSYYSSYIIECSDIMFKHLNEALKEISDKFGIMELTDCYRAMSYNSLKVLNSSFETKLTEEESLNINKLALSAVDSIIEKCKEKDNGKEVAYSLPIVMMDILAFKEFEYSKAKELEEKESVNNDK